MSSPNSKKIFKEAEKVLVGGVNSPVRSFKGVGGNPLIMQRGQGAKLYDVDGNAYTDYCLSWGALILGHAHRNVVLATRKRLNSGVSYGTSTRAELDIAKLIVDRVPSIEKIRFVNSGTEATMSAIRLARGFTGRSILVKFDGCYHGHFDDLLTKAGSGVAQLQESSSQGITPNHIETTLSLPYNNVAVLQETLTKHKDKIACVILEPVAGNMGVIRPSDEFLKAVRTLTKQYGIVLIFDEIMTGFRTSFNCAQAELGVTPDLTCLGKIIGGGFPIGAYGGRQDIMEHLAPLGGVYQAGTFSGNPVVMRAGFATLKMLGKSFYKTLNAKAGDFAGDLNSFFETEGVDARLSHFCSMQSIRFRKEPVLDYAGACDASDDTHYGKLFHHLLSKGIYFPPADLEAYFISGVHTKRDLSTLLNEIKNYFQKTKKGE